VIKLNSAANEPAYLLLSILPHAFLDPFTPPLPLLFCLIGAGFAVIASFILIGVVSRRSRFYSGYPKTNILKWSMARVVTGPVVILLIQLTSVLLFALVLLTGFAGSTDPLYNLAPTLIWVIWWVGVAYASAFLGDVWGLLNPWSIIFSWFETVVERLNAGKRLCAVMPYPERGGVWPAVAVFLIFAWVENVYGDSIIPSRISQMILVYSGFTWFGMILFGRTTWIKHGEAFSLAFGLLARFAPIEVRSVGSQVDTGIERTDGRGLPEVQAGFELFKKTPKEINLRPFGSGLLEMESVSVSGMLFVLLLLATVTFDGLTATSLWVTIQDSAMVYISNVSVISTLGLILSVVIFTVVYLVFCKLMSLVGRSQLNYLDFGKMFVYTLIPIALAYHVAHFLLFLLIQGQLIIPLASDPFGFGWDLFGTAGYRLNFKLVSSNSYWFISVISIVVGHIIAVFLSHSIAVRIQDAYGHARQSQYPMLVLMVGYTIASLWIITQPMYMSAM
jgi:hypothetical protein